MEKAKTGTILNLEGVQIMYPNFSGDPTPYNPNGGKRIFNARINDLKFGKQLMNAGWNVKAVPSRDDPDMTAFYSIQVEVKYSAQRSSLNPTIFQVTSHNTVKLDESTVSILDSVDIREADLVLRAYAWEVGGRSGIKAYLKTGYFVIEEDQFAQKYRVYDDDDIPF